MTRSEYSLILIAMLILSIILPTCLASIITNYKEIKHIVLHAPAVTSSGSGALTSITLAIGTPGRGRVFFSALPYTELDTQGAARVAAYIASLITRNDFSKYDYFVLIESDSPIIGGPSAGALMTIGFIALLGNYQLGQNVTMTGMINPDGTIGPVGGLKEKLEAVAQAGYRVFLIPSGQRLYQYPVYEERRLPWGVIRSIRYTTIDLVEYGKSLNVSVHEVKDIVDALRYFIDIRKSSASSSIATRYDDIVTDEVINILNEARSLVNTARDMLSRVRLTTWTIIQASRQLQYVNNTINQLYDLAKIYPYYAYRKALDTYANSFYLYWYTGIVSGSLSYDQLLSYINESLIEVFNNVFTPLRNTSLSLGTILEMSYPYALFLYAGYLFSQAVQASDYTSVLNYVSNAMKSLKELHIFTRITWQTSRVDYYSLVNTSKLLEIVNVIYAHALATSSYTTSLVSEVGYGGDPANLLNQYMNILSYIPRNDSLGVYGVSSMLIALSIYSTHYFLRTMSQGDIYLSQLNLLITYLNNDPSPVSALYLEIAREAVANNDYDTAIYSLSISIANTQCQLITQLMTQENLVTGGSTYTYPPITRSIEGIDTHVMTNVQSTVNTAIETITITTTTRNNTHSETPLTTNEITRSSSIDQNGALNPSIRGVKSLVYLLAGLLALISITLAIALAMQRGKRNTVTSQFAL